VNLKGESMTIANIQAWLSSMMLLAAALGSFFGVPLEQALVWAVIGVGMAVLALVYKKP